MKVGIFGGTFDPVHIGHLRAAEEIRESFALDRIYFVPVLIPPHKRDQYITAAGDRSKMIKLAIRGNRFLKQSELEIRRGGISYSIDTICAIEKRFGDPYFLIGADAFSEIHTWHRYPELFSHANFIVMVRPNHGKLVSLNIFPPDVREQMKVSGDLGDQDTGIGGRRKINQLLGSPAGGEIHQRERALPVR
jgi:nicotinate-nucleotide adenylyltransferase